MRRTRRSGGFFLCLLLNLLLNWEGVIPAALLFALHRWRGWLLWWAGLALALCGSRRDEARENKNPYSAKQYPNSGSAADKKTE